METETPAAPTETPVPPTEIVTIDPTETPASTEVPTATVTVTIQPTSTTGAPTITPTAVSGQPIASLPNTGNGGSSGSILIPALLILAATGFAMASAVIRRQQDERR